MVTPAGLVETRRLPGSGAGPSPDRLFIGSEGILGVITEAWMRLQDRPRFRASAQRHVRRLRRGRRGGARASRRRGSIPPTAACSTPGEAADRRRRDGRRSASSSLAFESADHPLDAWMARALECAARPRRHASRRAPGATRADRGGRARGRRRRLAAAFLDAPYLRDALVALGMVSETFETAITWDRFPAFHAGVTRGGRGRACGASAARARSRAASRTSTPTGRRPTTRCSRPAAAARSSSSGPRSRRPRRDAILAPGGTITHHHAVGRDHRPWYDRERPDGFAARAARRQARARSRRDPEPRRADRSGR